jgi:hypothetical protein
MGAKIVVILLVVVVLGLGLYVYNSGVVGKGINYLNTLAEHSSTAPLYVPPSSGGGNVITTPSAPTTIEPVQTSTTPVANATTSPYYGEVGFGEVYAGSGGSGGEISLDAYPKNASETIDVTGWLIEGNHGGIYIPQAVNVYDPLGLAPETDILLHYGDYLDIYESSAPVNLRLNECIGYLPNRSQFNPELPQNCPSTYNPSTTQAFTGACQNYINSLGSCQQPDMSSPEIPSNDYACVQYLENNFNYSSCFNQHDTDPNFLSNQVWVWTGSTPLDPYHDNVKLLDNNGLVVATYSY